MNNIIGITFAVVGIGAIFYAMSLKVPFTWENRMAWGVPFAITAFGIYLLLANRMDTPNYWDGPDILRLTSRPIPA
tara:strand:- start:24 stop:251 length:228 start_codon:yes stop_codon:yes gene_type:complete